MTIIKFSLDKIKSTYLGVTAAASNLHVTGDLTNYGGQCCHTPALPGNLLYRTYCPTVGGQGKFPSLYLAYACTLSLFTSVSFSVYLVCSFSSCLFRTIFWFLCSFLDFFLFLYFSYLLFSLLLLWTVCSS